MTQQADPNASPLKAAFSGRGFLIVVGVLALAAVGLNTVARTLEVHFKKQPVPLRHALDDEKAGIPREMGNWVCIHQTSSLDEDIQHALGTREFVFRVYANAGVVGRDTVERLQKLRQEVDALEVQEGADPKVKAARHNEWGGALHRLQVEHPEAVMSFSVTYYTGMVDSVLHIPERCMVADGYEPRNPQFVDLVAGTYADGSPRQVQIAFSTFEDQTGHGRVARDVAYLFHCNGGYEPSHVGVRGKLQNLFERHGYYAKVELMTDDLSRRDPRDANKEQAPQKSIEAMTDILTVALPEVERCLPDWNEVKGKTAVAAK